MTTVHSESFSTADRDRFHITAADGMVTLDISPAPEEALRLLPAEATELAHFLRNAADSFRNPDEVRAELVTYLSQCIRVIDGSHSLAAGALAEALVDCLISRGLLP